MRLLVRAKLTGYASVLQSIVLIAPMVGAGCRPDSANDITQAERDCAGGNQRACEMLDAIDDPNPAVVSSTPDRLARPGRPLLLRTTRLRPAAISWPSALSNNNPHCSRQVACKQSCRRERPLSEAGAFISTQSNVGVVGCVPPI
jgi:hypothetical protein